LVIDVGSKHAWDGAKSQALVAVGTVVGVAEYDQWDVGQGRHVHELSHHIGGRGGEQGGKIPQVSIWPPQQGQISMC